MNKVSELPPRLTTRSPTDPDTVVQPIDLVALALAWNMDRSTQETSIDVAGLHADFGNKADDLSLKQIERALRSLMLPPAT